MRIRHYTIIAVVVVGAAALANALLQGPQSDELQVRTAVAEKRRIVGDVQVQGVLEPVGKVRVSSSLSGNILKIHVEDGEIVAKGAKLADVDPGGLTARLQQQKALMRGTMATVSLKSARVNQSRRELDEAQNLVKKGFMSQAEFDRLSANFRVADAELQSARAQVAHARAVVSEIDDRLGRTQILAPVAGTVLSIIKKEGERIRGTEFGEDVLLTIGPLHSVEAEAMIPELDIVDVQVGDPASVKIPALKNLKIAGEVAGIGASAVINDKFRPTQTTEFRIRVSLSEIPKNLRAGMTAQVQIDANIVDDALAVPFEAITTRSLEELGDKAPDATGTQVQRQEIVFVIDGGMARAVPVRTGVAGRSYIQILEGLNPGDTVITGPYAAIAQTLSTGTKVKISGAPSQEDRPAASPVAAKNAAETE